MADLPWGDPRSRIFVTNIGLITSDGPIGPNVMAAEWTHHISYSPGLIAVCINPEDATHENIAATKEFGVNIAANDQNVLVSIAGNNTGRQVDKIKILEELGVKFYQAKYIKAPMIAGACLNAECKLIHQISLGDHTMFVGEVLEATLNPAKQPLIYHGGKYWKLGERLVRPAEYDPDRIQKLIEKYMRGFRPG